MKHNISLLKTLLILIIIFNIVDIIVSISTIHYGSAEETNPIMAVYLELGIIPFLFAKLILVGGGCIILWSRRQWLAARLGIYISFCYYLALMIYFLYNAVLVSEVSVWDY